MEEAKIILIGNDNFFGFLNIVFDYYLENKIIHKNNFNPTNVLQEIDKKSKNSVKKKIITTDKIYSQKKKIKGILSLEGKMVRSNFFQTELYKNHFMCSILSDLLLDLFLPHRCQHYDKFLKSTIL